MSKTPLSYRVLFLRTALASIIAAFSAACAEDDGSTLDAASPVLFGDAGANPWPTDAGSTSFGDAGALSTDASAQAGDSGVGTGGFDAGWSTPDAGPPILDAGSLDAGSSQTDAGASQTDAGSLDAGSLDAGSSQADADALDGGSPALDAGSLDAGPETSDGALDDAASMDGEAPEEDAQTPDAAVEQDAGPAHTDLGKGNGKDVITIGDSWMEYSANNGGIQAALERAAGQTYRKYAKAGAKLFKDTDLLFGLVHADAIPKQYTAAKRANADIKTVVMTGGGNDVLLEDSIDDCGTTTVGPKCQAQINKMAERLGALWKEMGADGVKDVIYIEYSSKTANPGAVLLGAEKIAPICAAASPVRCHFIAADDHMGRAQLLDDDPNAELVGATPPIHPTEEGCNIMGKAAYDLMVSEGMRR